MISIQEIADNIYNKAKPKSSQEFIYTFEKYSQVFDSLYDKLTSADYDIYSRLLADYGIALADAKSYRKAIVTIEKALLLFRNNLKFSDEDLKGLAFYEALLFKLGISLYYINENKKAELNFNLLKRLYPEHSTYSKWLLACRNRRINRLKNILWYCVASSTLVASFLKSQKISTLIIGIGVLCLLIAVTIEGYLYLERRRYGV